jgi:hypothetical protein
MYNIMYIMLELFTLVLDETTSKTKTAAYFPNADHFFFSFAIRI